MTYSNDPDRLRAGGRRWNNNHIGIAAVLGLVAVGGLWYGFDNFGHSVATKVPLAANTALVNPTEPGTPGRP